MRTTITGCPHDDSMTPPSTWNLCDGALAHRGAPLSTRQEQLYRLPIASLLSVLSLQLRHAGPVCSPGTGSQGGWRGVASHYAILAFYAQSTGLSAMYPKLKMSSPTSSPGAEMPHAPSKLNPEWTRAGFDYRDIICHMPCMLSRAARPAKGGRRAVQSTLAPCDRMKVTRSRRTAKAPSHKCLALLLHASDASPVLYGLQRCLTYRQRW